MGNQISCVLVGERRVDVLIVMRVFQLVVVILKRCVHDAKSTPIFSEVNVILAIFTFF